MSDRQKNIFFALLLLGVTYFLLFSFPNLTGAKDANMLAVFEVDEFAQYPHVIRMLTPGDTPYQTIRNFAVYLHYFYGYPFYFFSALALLPLKLALGADWTANTQAIMVVLRQVINVLPMIAAVMLLVFMQTRFQSWWRALGLFILLLAAPVVVVNNLWWHPDSLTFLFIVLTLFFLNRDDHHYGRNFFLAAVACGLATGTKHLGLFFVLAIPVYLAWGLIIKRLRWGRAILLGLGFVIVMALAVLISNPLLFLPQERAEIIQVQIRQFGQTSQGILTTSTNPYFAWGNYPDDFRIHYGEWFFVALSAISLALGIARPETRRLNVLILAWMIPLVVVISIFATRRTHYFLPVMLPMFSSLVNLFPPFTLDKLTRLQTWMRRIGAALGIVIISVQMSLYVVNDMNIYMQHMNREDNSASIQFYRGLQERVLPDLPNRNVVVYRDRQVYLPPINGWTIEMNWDLPTLSYIRELQPSMILLDKSSLEEYSTVQALENAIDPARMAEVQAFYLLAKDNGLPGYTLVYEDGFGMAFLRGE